MSGYGGAVVAAARVFLGVDDTELRADLEHDRRLFESSTGGMRTSLTRLEEAQLRAKLAQQSYTHAVAKYGPESRQAQNALLRVSAAQRLAGETAESAGRRTSRFGLQLRGASHEFGAFSRGGIASSGMLRGLGRSIAFASGAFLGGAGLVHALVSTVAAAEEEQKALAAVAATLEHVGVSWVRNRGQIEETLQAQVRLTAFTKIELLDSFNTLARYTGNVTRALKLNAVAADVARGKHLELTTAAALLIRAMAGNARAATTLGLPLDEVTRKLGRQAIAQKILAEATQRYGGQAAAFLTTAAGKQALFRAEVQRSQEIIGNAFLPTLATLSTRFANYLDQLNRSGQLQRDATHAVAQLREAFAGALTIFRGVKAVLGPIINLVGGLRHAVELLLALNLARRIEGWAGAFRTSLAPSLTQVGTEATIARGKVGGLSSALAGLPTRLVIQVAIATSIYGPAKKFFENHLGADYSGVQSDVAGRNRSPYPRGTELDDAWQAGRAGRPFPRRLGKGDAATRAAYQAGLAVNAARGAAAIGANAGARGGPRKRPPPATEIPLRLQLAVSQSRLTKSQRDDIAALEAERRFLVRALQDKRLKLKDRLKLTDELAGIDSELASLQQGKKPRKTRPATGAGLLPEAIRLRIAKARTTKTDADDIAALEDADHYLRRLLANRKLSLKRRREIYEQLGRIDTRIRQLKAKHDKQSADSTKSERQAFIEQRAGFLAEFAPNIFHKNAQGQLEFGSRQTSPEMQALEQERKQLETELRAKQRQLGERQRLNRLLASIDKRLLGERQRRMQMKAGTVAALRKAESARERLIPGGRFAKAKPGPAIAEKVAAARGGDHYRHIEIHQHFPAKPDSHFQSFRSARYAAEVAT